MTRKHAFVIALALGIVSLGGWRLAAQGPAYDVLIRGAQSSTAPATRSSTGTSRSRTDGLLRSATCGCHGDACHRWQGTRGRARVHRPPYAFGHAAARRRHRAEQGAAGRDARRYRRKQSVAPRDGMKPEGEQDWTDVHRLFRQAREAGHLDERHLAHRRRAGAPRRDGLRLEQPSRRTARADEAARRALDGRRRLGPGRRDSRAAVPSIPTRSSRWRRSSRSYGGNYTSHIGSEGYEQTEGARLRDSRRRRKPRCPVHIFHFKIRGKTAWGTIGKYIDADRGGARTRARRHREPVSVHARCSTAGARSSRCGFATAARSSSRRG